MLKYILKKGLCNMEKIVDALNRLTEAVEKQTECLSGMEKEQANFFYHVLLRGIDAKVDTNEIAEAIFALDKSLSEPGAKKHKTQE